MTKIPIGLCQCGCGKETSIAIRNRTKSGEVKGQPLRFARNHHRTQKRWDVDAATGCWNWLLCIDQNGYGRATHAGRDDMAHRSVYRQLRGDIPAGCELHHTCKNKSCVNPDHLEPVGKREHVQIEGTGKLTAGDVARIRALSASGWKQMAIAQLFRISRAHVSAVVLGKVWASFSCKVKKLRPSGHMPTCAHPGEDFGLDLRAAESITIFANSLGEVPTAIAIEFERGVGGLVWDRSSMARRGLKVVGGVIDNGYRGELIVMLHNLNPTPVDISAGDKVAQLVPTAILTSAVEEIAEFTTETARGDKGFGSSDWPIAPDGKPILYMEGGPCGLLGLERK